MSFICALTQKPQKSGVKPHQVVVQTRVKQYEQDVYNEETDDWDRRVVSTGWETVKQLNFSTEGLNIWDNMSDEDRSMFLNR